MFDWCDRRFRGFLVGKAIACLVATAVGCGSRDGIPSQQKNPSPQKTEKTSDAAPPARSDGDATPKSEEGVPPSTIAGEAKAASSDPAPSRRTPEDSAPAESAPAKPVQPQEEATLPNSGQTFHGTMRAVIPLTRRADYVAWSPDGRWILSGDHECSVWDARTGKSARRLGEATVAAFHPDGRRVIGANEQGLVAWDVASGSLGRVVRGPSGAKSLRFSANGDRIVALNQFFRGGVWDLQAGRWRPFDREALGVDLRTADVSPDGKTIALTTETGKLVLLDGDTLAVSATRDVNDGQVDGVAFSPDGRTIATNGSSKSERNRLVRIWNAATGEKLHEFPCDDYLGTGLRFSPGGTMLAVVGSQLYVEDPHGPGKSRSVFDRGGWSVNDVAFSPDGRRIAIVTNKDDALYVQDLGKTRQHATYAVNEEWRTVRLVPSGEGGATLALNGYRTPTLVDLPKGTVLRELGKEVYKSDSPSVFAVSPDGTTCAGGDLGLHVWKTADGTKVRSFEGSFTSAAFSADGRLLLLGKWGTDESVALRHGVQVVDTAGGATVREFAGHAESVRSAATSPDGKWLASGGLDAHVCLFDFASGELRHREFVHEREVTALRFSPDGRWLASVAGEKDPEVGLWKIGEPRPVLLEGHSAPVVGAVFSRDSTRLATLDRKGSLRIWNLSGRNESFETRAHSGDDPQLKPIPGIDGFLTFCAGEKTAKRWHFDELRPPRAASDDVVRTDVREGPDRRMAADSGLLGGFRGPKGRSVSHLAVSADEALAATVGYEGEVVLWDLPALRREIAGRNAAGAPDVRSVLGQDEGPIGERFVVRSFQAAESGKVAGLSFSKDGKRLAVVSEGEKGGIRIWDVAKGTQIAELPGPADSVKTVAPPATDLVAVHDVKDPFVRLYDVAAGKELPRVPFDQGEDEKVVACVGFDADGRHLYVKSVHKLVAFETATRKRLWEAEIFGHARTIRGTPDGKRVVLVSESGIEGAKAIVLDAANGREVRSFEIPVRAGWFDLTEDGRHLVVLAATGYGYGGTPMFVDAETGRIDRTLPFDATGLHFAADRETLVVASGDGPAIGVVSRAAAWNEELQSAVGKLRAASELTVRDGPYFRVPLAVDGRRSREALRSIVDVPLPLKLAFDMSINLTDAELALLEGAPHVRGVELSSFSPERTTAAGIRSLAAIPELDELVIHKPTEAMLRELAAFPKLRILQLGPTQAPAESFGVLAKLPQLRVVQISLDERRIDEVLPVLVGLPELRTLRLGLGYGTWSAERIERLAACPQLESLALADGRWNDEAAAGLARLKRLKELRLPGAQLGRDGFAHLTALVDLEGLDLNGSNLRDAEQLAGLKNLKWVRLPFDGEPVVDALRKTRPDLRAFVR